MKKKYFIWSIVGVLLFGFVFFLPLANKNDVTKSGTVQFENERITSKAEEGTLLISLPKVDQEEKKSKEKKTISTLDIILSDVFLGKKKGSGYAILSYEKKTAQVYIVGAKLTDGVFLKSLNDKSVDIDNHGNLERYYKKEKTPVNANKSAKLDQFSKSQENPNKEVLIPSNIDDAPPMDSISPPIPSFDDLDKSSNELPPNFPAPSDEVFTPSF